MIFMLLFFFSDFVSHPKFHSDLKMKVEYRFLQQDTIDMDSLLVPDNFNYKTTRHIKLNIHFESVESKNLKNTFFQLLGVCDSILEPDVLMQGMVDEQGFIQTSLELPLHFTRIMLKIQNRSFEKTFLMEAVPEIHISFQVDEPKTN